jgi:hypothetical protein
MEFNLVKILCYIYKNFFHTHYFKLLNESYA